MIWGVLYEVPYVIGRATAGARRSLDAIEGSHYQRRPIAVQKADGTPVEGEVMTYAVRAPQPGLRTSLDYVSHIAAGLREHGAPNDYVAYVKERAIANDPAVATDLERL